MNPVTDKSNVAIGVYVNTSETVNGSNYKRGVVGNDSDIADDGTFSVTVTGLSDVDKSEIDAIGQLLLAITARTA